MQSRLGAGTQSTWADRPSSRGGVQLRYGSATLVDVKASKWPAHIEGTYASDDRRAIMPKMRSTLEMYLDLWKVEG